MGMFDTNAAPAQGGGMFAGMGATPAPQQAGSSAQWLQMCQALIQNPTPQTVQQVAMQLQKSGVEGADQIVQMLQQLANDPESVKQFAQQAMQELSKGAQ